MLIWYTFHQIQSHRYAYIIVLISFILDTHYRREEISCVTMYNQNKTLINVYSDECFSCTQRVRRFRDGQEGSDQVFKVTKYLKNDRNSVSKNFNRSKYFY